MIDWWGCACGALGQTWARSLSRCCCFGGGRNSENAHDHHRAGGASKERRKGIVASTPTRAAHGSSPGGLVQAAWLGRTWGTAGPVEADCHSISLHVARACARLWSEKLASAPTVRLDPQMHVLHSRKDCTTTTTAFLPFEKCGSIVVTCILKRLPPEQFDYMHGLIYPSYS
jgi:hypothetical protein